MSGVVDFFENFGRTDGAENGQKNETQQQLHLLLGEFARGEETRLNIPEMFFGWRLHKLTLCRMYFTFIQFSDSINTIDILRFVDHVKTTRQNHSFCSSMFSLPYSSTHLKVPLGCASTYRGATALRHPPIREFCFNPYLLFYKLAMWHLWQ